MSLEDREAVGDIILNKVSTFAVTIPFNGLNKVGDKSLNIYQIKVLAEIRNNPNITKNELTIKCDLGKTSIDNIISRLKNVA